MNKSLAFISALLVISSLCLLAITQQSCNKTTGCGGLKCDNGGTCANGGCLCAAGYTGYTCDTPAYAQYVGNYTGIFVLNNTNINDTVVVAGVVGNPDSVTINGLGANGLTASFNLVGKIYMPPQIIMFQGDTCSETGIGNFNPPKLTFNVTINSVNSSAINIGGTFTGTLP